MKRLLLIAALLSAPAMAKDSDVCSYAYKLTKAVIEARMNGVSEMEIYQSAIKSNNVLKKRIVLKVYNAKPDELPTMAQSVFVGCLKAFREDV